MLVQAVRPAAQLAASAARAEWPARSGCGAGGCDRPVRCLPVVICISWAAARGWCRTNIRRSTPRLCLLLVWACLVTTEQPKRLLESRRHGRMVLGPRMARALSWGPCRDLA